ncbi:MAG: DUF4232 domain-containing protein [Solirubrobacterales bacterium]|nr:DUF4232 domain-containing protein [Solirubrobacterales bacterium]
MPSWTIRRRSLRYGLVAAIGCVLALAIARPSVSLGSSTPACSTSNLRLDLVQESAATSHRFWDLSLRNVGSLTCHMKGYPGVGMLDASARLINVPVDRTSGVQVRKVVLGPWQRAYFTFGYVVSGPCLPHFFSAYGLQVFAPNTSQRMVYYHGRFDVCSASAAGHPQVWPVRPLLNTL